jgi:hypothetical protein
MAVIPVYLLLLVVAGLGMGQVGHFFSFYPVKVQYCTYCVRHSCTFFSCFGSSLSSDILYVLFLPAVFLKKRCFLFFFYPAISNLWDTGYVTHTTVRTVSSGYRMCCSF